jgi:hypothetical protein
MGVDFMDDLLSGVQSSKFKVGGIDLWGRQKRPAGLARGLVVGARVRGVRRVAGTTKPQVAVAPAVSLRALLWVGEAYRHSGLCLEVHRRATRLSAAPGTDGVGDAATALAFDLPGTHGRGPAEHSDRGSQTAPPLG